jgi:hypothetical protein
MNQWRDIEDEHQPIPGHPGAASARNWVQRRSAELAGRDAYSRAQLPAAPVATVPKSQPTTRVSRLRLWLSTFVYLGVGATLACDLLLNRGGLLYGDPSVPTLLLGGVGAGFVSSLILRVGRHSNAGGTVGDSIRSLLAANLLAYISVVVFALATAFQSDHASLNGVIEGALFVALIVGGSLSLQIPSVLAGVGIGCAMTPNRKS